MEGIKMKNQTLKIMALGLVLAFCIVGIVTAAEPLPKTPLEGYADVALQQLKEQHQPYCICIEPKMLLAELGGG